MSETIRVELEFVADRDRFAGVLSSPALPSRPFDGWLELASVIEEVHAAAAMAGDHPAAE